MRNLQPMMVALAVGALMLIAGDASAQDWPQWRGPNRDAKATGFTAPKTWPKELTEKWKVTVGEGVATPALVGDKLYVFSREGGNEMVRCLNADTGKEIWQDKYESEAVGGPAGAFSGPRSSPAIADGKLLTMGVHGVISCYDAASGKKLWRSEDFTDVVPMFSVASSPILVDRLCIAQLGGDGAGGIVALDLATGVEKWRWAGDGTGYASPVLATIDGEKAIVAETASKIVAVSLAGKQLWTTPFARQGRSYQACTPIIDGQTVVFSGTPRGTKAFKLEKKGDEFNGKELWSNKDTSVQFNTPVIKDGSVFGISESNKLFCISMESGKTSWSTLAPGASAAAAPGGPPGGRPDGPPGGPPGGGRPGGGRMGGGMGMGRDGYGSVVDAGSVLFALTPGGKLAVFEPSDKEFKQVALYTVAKEGTYAYPVVAGNRIFVKDKESVKLFMID